MQDWIEAKQKGLPGKTKNIPTGFLIAFTLISGTKPIFLTAHGHGLIVNVCIVNFIAIPFAGQQKQAYLSVNTKNNNY